MTGRAIVATVSARPALRLFCRRHIDLQRVCAALCCAVLGSPRPLRDA